MPVAKLKAASSTWNWLHQHSIEVIPVVFITNESLLQTSENNLPLLADNIYQLLTSQLKEYAITPKEIQIDCDWTATTRDKYFSLLQFFRQQPLCKNHQTLLSATIRLYQCKYRIKTGVPPVDRGLLMCYNMGNLKNPDTRNSILEASELKKYIANLDTYPLPLDVAFPLFNWMVLYRNNTYTGLIQNLMADSLRQQSFVETRDNRFVIKSDTVWNGYIFKKEDILRYEKSDISEILRAEKALADHWKTQQFTLSLFHLDSTVLTQYPSYELEKIFTAMQ